MMVRELGCTVHKVTVQGQSGEACLTADGVMVRGRGGEAGKEFEMRAVKVTYEKQPAALFAPPDGFNRIDTPAR